MGFEDFHLSLVPKDVVDALAAPSCQAALDEMVALLTRRWPAIAPDHEAERYLWREKRPDEVFLCYRTPGELFQLRLHQPADQRPGSLAVEMRFAYCNPRSIFEPFCAVAQWLMGRWNLECHVMRDLGPALDGIPSVASEPVAAADALSPVLMPSLDYNRCLWEREGWTEEEAPLRPEEAIARFVLPHCEPGA